MGAFDRMSASTGVCEAMQWMCALVKNFKDFKPDTIFYRVSEKREALAAQFAIEDDVPRVGDLLDLETQEETKGGQTEQLPDIIEFDENSDKKDVKDEKYFDVMMRTLSKQNLMKNI